MPPDLTVPQDLFALEEFPLGLLEEGSLSLDFCFLSDFGILGPSGEAGSNIIQYKRRKYLDKRYRTGTRKG